MKKIIATGGQGYIASLVRHYNESLFEWVSLGRKELDLKETDKVAEYFNNADFDIVFHAGAMPKTSDCENFPELTYLVNVASTKELVKACKRKNKRLVFISSEQVYNGKKERGPFAEDEPTSAVTAYGRHKIECEEYIIENLNDYLILRFSWMFGMSMPNVKVSANIISNVMNAMFYRKPTLFTVNEKRGFTYAHVVAENFNKIVNLPTGIYNVTSECDLTTYEAAREVAYKLGFSKEETDKYILPNHERYKDRFRDYRLDNTKIKQAGIPLANFHEEMNRCLSDFGWLKKSDNV